ncbi:MAG: hypothetical protein Q9M92_16985 [Enterobacterales bacterium]|nr:hypothetical protein [Enterobacterales bacterium]
MVQCRFFINQAELAKRELDDKWSENYFDLFGQWNGEALKRAVQPKLESQDYEW